MLKQSINSTEDVIYTEDRISDIKKIASEIGCIKKDGDYYKSAYVNLNGSYNFNNSAETLDATYIKFKNKHYYILNDTYNFNYTDANALCYRMNIFGHSFIKINNELVEGPFNVNNKKIIDANEKNIIINNSDSVEKKKIDEFIYKITSDNGRLLYPVIQKYLTVLYKIGNKKDFLTGYMNLSHYLYFSNNDFSSTFQMHKTESIDIELKNNNIELKIVNIINNLLYIDFNFNGNFSAINEKEKKITPYLFFTSKPITFKTQKIPFNVVRYKGISVFISPMYFTDDSIMKNIKGGINLLK